MKTKICNINPFRKTFRYDHAFVFEKLKKQTQSQTSTINVLDYGGNDGKLVRECIQSGLKFNALCVDANAEAILLGQSKSEDFNQLEFKILSDFCLKSYAGKFDVILLIGVLEHVVDQQGLLKRLRSLIKQNGEIIISVPGAHIFSFADFGNWKFYFPKLHKYFVVKSQGSKYYQEHFVDCVNGLFGDIEVGKNSHQHFRRQELIDFCDSSGFSVIEIDGYGFFHYILHNVRHFLPTQLKQPLLDLMIIDNEYGSSAQIVCRARAV